MDIRQRILEVLQNGYLMSLATQDDGGVWVSDVIYIFDENLTLYWMSDPDVRHSQAIVQNPQVAGTITVSNTNKEPDLGIQFSGIATKVDGARFDLAKKHLQKRGHPEPEEEDDVLQGDSWYILKLSKIDIIDKVKWGYEKKSLNLYLLQSQIG